MAFFKSQAGTGEAWAVIKRILRENGREYYRLYALAAVCLVVVSLTTGYYAFILRYVIDDIFYRQRFDLLALISVSIVVAFLLRGAATYGQAVIMARIGNNLVARYQTRLFDHLMKLGVSFFTQRRSGVLAAQLNENIIGIRDMIGLTLTAVARDLATVVVLIGVMVWQSPVMSLASFLIGPPLIVGIRYLSRRVRALARQQVVVNSRLIGAIQESTQGIAVVKAFTMEDQLAARMKRLIAESEQRSNKIAAVTERLGPLTESMAGFVVAGVIGFAGYQMARDNTPPGAIVAFITAFFLAYDPVKRLARVQVGLERALVNARMIYEVLDEEPPQREAPDAAELRAGPGEVAFDKVSFSYVAGSPVLDEVSFVAAPGRTTAVIGASGAGKSTLLSLLERFYDVDSGAIRIDGQDIAQVTKNSLRRNIAFVTQQPYLFEGTIRDNIRYGRADATDAEIEEAARLANADEFIRQQPQGYDTPVGENGATLSGGQRQRLAIARAIVRNAPILVLDEATSALDNESEAKVQAALNGVMQGRTTIVVAHRLSTIVNAHRIIVLEEGRVVEQGVHDELLRKPGGVYARFYNLQANRSVDLIDLGGAGKMGELG